MILVPLTDSHITAWREAVDRTGISPCPTGGPEYAASMDVAWNNTFIYSAGDLFLPFSRRRSTHMGLLTSDHWVGVQYNSFLGIPKVTADWLERLTELPRNCVITLHVPSAEYEPNCGLFTKLNYHQSGAYDFHKAVLGPTYEDWFNQKPVQRNVLRRAANVGIEVKFGGREQLEQFYEIYEHSVRRWQGRDPTASYHRFDRIERLFKFPGSTAEIAVGYYQGEAISSVIFGGYRRTGAYLFGGFKYEYQQLRATNYVHAMIIKRLTERGIQEYSLGMSLGRFNLEGFKERLGGVRYRCIVLTRHRFPRLKKIITQLRKSQSPTRTSGEAPDQGVTI